VQAADLLRELISRHGLIGVKCCLFASQNTSHQPHGSYFMQTKPNVAVLIPCHNEATTVASVVNAFRRALPGAAIHVCDNNSSDATAQIARGAQAKVWSESHPGKGNAVRRLFAEIEADAMSWSTAMRPRCLRCACHA
jgi:cellulose synthase/poly-beta-1,6-N-acetylglucosamine synthase-like glycosyltransferase